jgi:hypothetical protein
VKKSLITLLVVSFVLAIAGTAMAFPVDFTGSINTSFVNWQDKVGTVANPADPINSNHNDFRTTIKLNFSAQVDQDVTMFGRFGEETRSFSRQGSAQQDPGKDLLDQYGVKIANNGWDYTVGRQALSLGQGTIAGFGNGVANCDAKFDGLVAAGKLGKVDTKIAVGRATTTGGNGYNYGAYNDGFTSPAVNNGNAIFSDASKTIEGIDLSTALTDNLTFGATYAAIDTADTNLAASKYLGVNATFNPTANLALNAEYVKSSLDTNNKAYFVAGTYSWDKDWFMIQYQNVGINGADVNISGIGVNEYPYFGANLLNDVKYTGFTYDYNHQLSKAAALNICYMTLKTPNQTGNDNELGAGVTWSF